ncbi:stage V sporulation protein SpoVM [Clostridium sp. ZS2-4]
MIGLIKIYFKGVIMKIIAIKLPKFLSRIVRIFTKNKN